MKPTNRYMSDMLDLELPDAAGDILWRAGNPISAEMVGNQIVFQVPFQAQKRSMDIASDPEIPRRLVPVVIRAYGDSVIRLTTMFSGSLPGDENVMLEWHPTLKPAALKIKETPEGWEVVDPEGARRFAVNTQAPEIQPWSNLLPPPDETFNATVYPDGKTPVAFMAYDQFFPAAHASMALAYIERAGQPHRAAYSIAAAPDEHFAGTGERFTELDLSGSTLVLENIDALGVNSRQVYKNIPFYVSSRSYGLLILTSAHLRLSLKDISTRAAQGMVEDGILDLFFIGGGSLEQVLYNYRRITGFPRMVPLWSFGTWMSRMSYMSADETRTVARRLRQGNFPCDVIHVDTGWFSKDWQCDWEFSPERFPNPESYLAEMRKDGFRISLWQMPTVSKENTRFPEASEHGYLAGRQRAVTGESDFSGQAYAATIDFSNPSAVAWYQSMLAKLLKMGTAVIKTDFGETIDMDSIYHSLPARLLHNLYALLYQKAAFEITEQTTGEGIIWARSSWVGSQRYPVHWGGDAACSWDGLAGSIRGGLHIGLSGFAFWSHDVPGFHGVPNFMNSWPPDDLYVRWTQVGVFTSHFRYHGAQPREPYEYPAIAETIRKWWRLRYALIPYLWQQGQQATQTGYPVLRALVLHHAEDPTCWHIDDQFYCGNALMVAPILNSEGRRKVYLPQGEWVDLWTGNILKGGQWLEICMPLEHLPVYAVYGSCIPYYPIPVQHTGEIDMAKIAYLTFDRTYRGLSATPLGNVTGL